MEMPDPENKADIAGPAEMPAPTAPVNRKLIPLVAIVAGGALVGLACAKPAQLGNTATEKAPPPTVMTTYVVSQTVNKELRLPGELRAFQNVAIYPKVQSFVDSINVDRGSVVKRGQVLVRMSAPELASHTSEAEARVRAAQQQRFEMESRVQSARAQRAEAEAKLASDEGTYKRLKAASAMPGVVAENEGDVARGTVEGDKARIRALEANAKAATARVQSQVEDQRA